MNQYAEILEETINRRFDHATSTDHNRDAIDKEFYIDLLCVFHDPDRFEASDFTKHSIGVILNYLRQTHKLYLNRSLAELEYAAATLAAKEPELSHVQEIVQEFFGRFKQSLETHIQEEEQHLFPYIDYLSKITGNGDKGQFTSSNRLMDFMLHHDDELEAAMSDMVNQLSKMPATYQSSFAYRMLLTRFSIFELDLRIHGKMEDEVLVPMALQLEQQVKGVE